ncbi:hypothetical protein ACH5RR_029217 [Cinchona calisaya]|uniref:Uncharacterized protein n=1 Tax=Cinchona calisaya TaxID=153742 RepID=A0ABD2YT85_9GENT
MIPKASNKETKDIPTQNPKSNLTEKEVNVSNEEQSSKIVVDMSANGGKMPLFDDHEQPIDLVDDTIEEIEVLVTRPSKFDVLSNVIHSSSNADFSKNFEDGGNDAAKSQASTQMEKTIMTWRTLPVQSTSIEK